MAASRSEQYKRAHVKNIMNGNTTGTGVATPAGNVLCDAGALTDQSHPRRPLSNIVEHIDQVAQPEPTMEGTPSSLRQQNQPKQVFHSPE